MSPLTAKPVLHGRDHCPGGADPIPCLQTGAGGTFEETVLATSDLLAYWRLGETGSPWADTSGVGTPTDLVQSGSGTALTPDVTGALTVGDDGALELNYDGVANGGGRYATAGSDVTKDFDMPGGAMTVAAWVKVKASSTTRRGVIIGTSNIAAGSGAKQGWGLQVVYPSQTVRFTRGDQGGTERYAETAAGVVAGDWNLFVGTHDGTTLRLYANGVLVGTAASSAGAASLGGAISVGFGYGEYAVGSAVASWFYGAIDEAAIWTRALTQSEIDALYTSGVDTTVGSGTRVLVSDGHGGFTWGKATPEAIEPGDDGDVLTTSDGATVWAPPTGGSPAADTFVWMPLTTVVSSVPELVWDANDSLIPTLTPI